MKYEYIDIHTHVNLSAFKGDYDSVIKRALKNNVHMINVGTEYSTSKRAVEMLDEYDEGVYATVGLHPIHTSDSYYDKDELDENEKQVAENGEVFNADKYMDLAMNDRVVAVGECGLDYFRKISDEDKKKQIEAFEAQIAFANEIKKPLMLHLRSGESGDAYKDALVILKNHAKVRGNAHFFAGSLDDAKKFWDMGYSTSFTGVITFTHDYDEVVKNAPHELIHAETDAPYVSPEPYRGQRNEPMHVIEVVKKMANLRDILEDDLMEQLKINAKKFFNL